jgi:hypothetical protein
MGFRKSITIYNAAGAYVDGYWVPGIETSQTITASVQPVTGNALQALPENRRTGGVFALFSDHAFNSGGVPGTQPDQVEISGTRYECFQSEPWGNDVINHYKGLFSGIY